MRGGTLRGGEIVEQSQTYGSRNIPHAPQPLTSLKGHRSPNSGPIDRRKKHKALLRQSLTGQDERLEGGQVGGRKFAVERGQRLAQGLSSGGTRQGKEGRGTVRRGEARFERGSPCCEVKGIRARETRIAGTHSVGVGPSRGAHVGGGRQKGRHGARITQRRVEPEIGRTWGVKHIHDCAGLRPRYLDADREPLEQTDFCPEIDRGHFLLHSAGGWSECRDVIRDSGQVSYSCAKILEARKELCRVPRGQILAKFFDGS